MITITVDTSRFDRMMSDFPVRLAAAKKRALWYIGQAVASRATQAFRTAASNGRVRYDNTGSN